MTGPASTPPVLIITGPTASGKTETAILLAEALDGEIISADSMQVYCGLDIGTAKASAADRLRVPHHLLDIRRPGEPFSVAEYQALAEQTIKAIQGRGRRPIICGGTGQYLSALIDGLAFPLGSPDPELRFSLNREADELGLPALWARLQACDPDTAGRLPATDRKRIIRALELYQLSGKPMSWHLAQSRLLGPAFVYAGFCLSHERAALYQRIDRRVVQMIENGLVEEAGKLAALNLPAGSTCLQSIGYKELFGYLRGETGLDDAIALIQQATRRYAKRQLTWFRKMTQLTWLEHLNPAEAANMICNILQNSVK